MTPVILSIVKKDEVVQRLAKRDNKELRDCVEALNKILGEATNLPIYVEGVKLGVNPVTKMEIMRMLKAAGWRCDPVKVPEGAFARYEIQ